MPHLDGFKVMDQLRPLIPDAVYLPILVLTGDHDPVIRQRALAAGAKDFLSKPFELTEVLLRIHNLLETRFLHLALKNHNETLEQKVRERTRELADAKAEILHRLASRPNTGTTSRDGTRSGLVPFHRGSGKQWGFRRKSRACCDEPRLFTMWARSGFRMRSS